MVSTAPLLEPSSYAGGKLENKNVWLSLDVEEARRQLMLSLPMILTNVSYYSFTLISVMFAGHLGEIELAASFLGNTWSTVTGLALMTGLSGALETLCGQGYGAKLFRMLGIYLQSSIITSFIFSFLCLSCGLFAYGFLQCTLRFLQTQSIVIPLVVCSLVPLVIHIGITYLLVHHTPLGFRGAPLGASISLWLSFIMLASYIKLSEKFKYTWEGLSMESFHYVLPNLSLAIPSAVMVCLEYWAFEVLVLLAGLMPNSTDSTSLIAMCVNTEAVTFMITYGFSAAVSTRVSNEIGAGNVDLAKNAVRVTLKLSLMLSLIIVLLLGLGHNIWAGFFSDSPIIKSEFASMTPFLVISILFDSMQGVLSGVTRGCGWQILAAWVNLGSFYIIAMPIAILLGFKLNLHAKGLWMGLICGIFCQACTLLVIAFRHKWEKIVISNEENENEAAV